MGMGGSIARSFWGFVCSESGGERIGKGEVRRCVKARGICVGVYGR